MIYALLIYSQASEQTPLTEEALETALVQHRALQEEAAGAGELLNVARLEDPAGAKTVRMSGTSSVVFDGPYMESKEWLAGFYLVECTNEQEALARAKRIVTSNMHCVEVRPVNWHHHEP